MIEFISIKRKENPPTARVYKTGDLGFNLSANNLIGIEKGSYFQFAKDENDNYYLYHTNKPKDALKAIAAGKYFAIKKVIDLGLPVKHGDVYVLEKVVEKEQIFYKLILFDQKGAQPC